MDRPETIINPSMMRRKMPGSSRRTKPLAMKAPAISEAPTIRPLMKVESSSAPKPRNVMLFAIDPERACGFRHDSGDRHDRHCFLWPERVDEHGRHHDRRAHADDAAGGEAEDADEQEGQAGVRIGKDGAGIMPRGRARKSRGLAAQKKPRCRFGAGHRGGSYRCLRVVGTARLLLKMKNSTRRLFLERGRVSQGQNGAGIRSKYRKNAGYFALRVVWPVDYSLPDQCRFGCLRNCERSPERIVTSKVSPSR